MVFPFVIKLNSKLHWTAFIGGSLGGLYTWLPEVRAFLDPEMYGYVLMGLALATWIFRNFTFVPIDEK